MEDVFIHESSYVDKGCSVGAGSKIWHFCHIMKDASLGKACILGQNVFVANDVRLGNNVKVQNNVSIYTGVICEDDVFLGPSMVFTNISNPRSKVVRKGNYEKTLVREGASIGANATIVCGNEIGKFAFIAAGTVVTRDVNAYALMIGAPAKRVGWMSEYGHRLDFGEDGIAICPESAEVYQLQEGNVVKLKSDA